MITSWLGDIDRLARVCNMNIQASLDLDTLPKRGRNAILRALRSGYITGLVHTTTNRMAYEMLKSAGVFFMWSKIRGYVYLQQQGIRPAFLKDPLEALREADETATKVQGKSYDGRSYGGGIHFHTIKPHQHVPEYLAPYTSTDEYKAAVAPFIEAVQEGHTIPITVKRSPKWISTNS